MRRSEIFVPLSIDFPDNRKVRALSRYGRDARPARDLYVQMLIYCKRAKSDGFVPDEQLGLLAYPDPVKFARRDAEHLADVGLIERGAGGWLLSGWLERNPSRASVMATSERKSRGARHANHKRWHSGTPDPDCEWCQTSDQTSDQRSDRSTEVDPTLNRDASESIDVDVDEHVDEHVDEEKKIKPLGQQAGRQPEPGSDDDPDFAAFWGAYPRKVAKGAARKAWKSALTRRKADAKQVILAAEHYRDDPRRRAKDIELTAHPATWLNADRWLDYEHQQPQPAPQVAWWNA